MGKIFGAAVMAVATLALSDVASAATFLITFEGTVHPDGGVDTLGLFGGGSHAGEAFKVVYIFDDSKPVAFDFVQGTSAAGYRAIAGEGPEGLITAVFTMNGRAFNFGQQAGAGQKFNNWYGQDGLYFNILNSNVATLSNAIYAPEMFDDIDIGREVSFALPAGQFSSGQLLVSDLDRDLHTYLTLLNTSVSVRAAAPVPEPSTWAMMLVGFGAIGFAMRHRRRALPKVSFAF